MNQSIPENIKTSFETANEFRMLAPLSVAQGMVLMADNDYENESNQRQNAAYMMDLIANNVPQIEETKTSKSGKKTVESYNKYSPVFTEAMIKEIEAKYKELSVSDAHEYRFKQALEYMKNFKPTISLGEALYRLSFYLICNENNLAKSTNNLILFVQRMFRDKANNMLVDSAILQGGQGKSTIQKGFLQAAKEIGFNSSECHLPSISGGVQEAFVRNEVCVDEETHFNAIDIDSLNRVLDKSVVTIKGKYIKEWSAKSTANVLVGTNFLPNDVNARRYSVRMVDENFRLNENFGRWTIPGTLGDMYGDSYDRVIEWTKEGWLNLFYYCNKYDIKPIPFTETSFNYNLQYRLKRTLDESGQYELTIQDVIKLLELTEGDRFDYKSKQQLRNQLYILANQLDLPIIERHHNTYSKYDWHKALEIDETYFDKDTLEKVFCFFHHERFNTPEFESVV